MIGASHGPIAQAHDRLRAERFAALAAPAICPLASGLGGVSGCDLRLFAFLRLVAAALLSYFSGSASFWLIRSLAAPDSLSSDAKAPDVAAFRMTRRNNTTPRRYRRHERQIIR
jgi:hypothetical protein